MCTILFMHGVHPDHCLVIAANRDERHDRPSKPPQLIDRAPAVLAGVDELAGGTWMGANEVGIAVGLTNQRTYSPPDPDARSRGEVVRNLLTARTHDEVERKLDAIDCRAYNPFNLLIGSAQRVLLAYARREQRAIEVVEAPTGVHVLPNDRLFADGFPKAARAVQLATAIATEPWPVLAEGLATVLGDHALPDLSEVEPPPPHSIHDLELLHRHQAICIHDSHYGTRSATVLALSPGAVDHYLFSDGPPCTAPFGEYAHHLSAGG